MKYDKSSLFSYLIDTFIPLEDTENNYKKSDTNNPIHKTEHDDKSNSSDNDGIYKLYLILNLSILNSIRFIFIIR